YKDGGGQFRYVYQYRDHLGNVRLSYQDSNNDGTIDPSTEILSEKNYYPFGLKHQGYNSNISGGENNYMTFQGKEHQRELGLETYDFGFRAFDPAIARWTVVDPLAERRYELTPYNFVQNSPMFRIDPDGLTDFALNKETGEVSQVGETNDDPDRIVKTDKNGNVKKKGEGFLGFLVRKSERGKAKVAVDGIGKGILKDGQNFKTENNAFEVGGEGQPTEQDVESFALKLSDYVGTEIGGAYFSKDGESTTHITIGRYKDNSYKKTKSYGVGAFREFVSTVKEFTSSLTGFFHTHPNGVGISDSDRLVPSLPDRESRDNALDANPSLKFFLLTHPDYGGRFPKKINYTTGYPSSDRR
ncbi:RHS repeat-associated core domain-containing protein, partial [Ascidiimonas aurantiaca]|uniref:RHS repeat domain-containing protein n=1 Tax=Ascidiimonas aurantiaca TaxID=1685432 RepID=UPI0030EB7BD5